MFHQGTLNKVLGTAASAVLCVTVAAPAQAFTWNYSWDSFNDGTGDFLTTTGHGVGEDSKYEIFGTAYGYDKKNDKVFFAFSSNIPLLGHSSTNAKDGNIGWGDLFINLDPTKTFTEVQGTSSLLGIRFAGTNDSGIDPTTNNGNYVKKVNTSNGVTGIYQGVTTKNVTSANNGWSSYTAYNNYVSPAKNAKGTVELIDGMTRTEAENYLGAHGRSVIGTAQKKIGDINLLDEVSLASLGLDFGGMGSQTFGFSFNRSVLPAGNLSWIHHILAECANDTAGGSGEIQDVPEPSALGTLALAGVILGGGMLKRRKADQAA